MEVIKTEKPNRQFFKWENKGPDPCLLTIPISAQYAKCMAQGDKAACLDKQLLQISLMYNYFKFRDLIFSIYGTYKQEDLYQKSLLKNTWQLHYLLMETLFIFVDLEYSSEYPSYVAYFSIIASLMPSRNITVQLEVYFHV